ncbi:MAG: DNA polymerase III subunit beta [Anaerolineae bacterium]
MQVSVLQDKFAKGLDTVARAVSSHPTMPVLGNILLVTEEARLRLSATNLELSITARIGAKVDLDGQITVPARTLIDLVKTLPPERIDLEVETDTQTLILTCGKFTARIKGIDAEQFPRIPSADTDGMELPANLLRGMIEQTVFAAAKEDNRPILMGVLTRFESDKIAMVAADGYRMAMRVEPLEKPVNQQTTLVIPARALDEIARIVKGDDGSVFITTPKDRNQVMFNLSHSDVEVVSQLIDGKFPDVEQLIPKSSQTTSRVDVTDFAVACKRAEIFARDSSFTTRIKVNTDKLVISAQAQETGENEGAIDAVVQGTPLEIAFNVRYLLDVFSVLGTEQVAMETNGAAAPGVFRPVNEDGSIDTNFTYIVMPMSVR